MASEGELGRKWDRCLADSAVKLGTGGERPASRGGPGEERRRPSGQLGACGGRLTARPAARPCWVPEGPAAAGAPPALPGLA